MVEREVVGPLPGEKKLPAGLCAPGASPVRPQKGRWRSLSSERDPSESFGLSAETSGGLAVSYTTQKRTEIVPVGL